MRAQWFGILCLGAQACGVVGERFGEWLGNGTTSGTSGWEGGKVEVGGAGVGGDGEGGIRVEVEDLVRTMTMTVTGEEGVVGRKAAGQLETVAWEDVLPTMVVTPTQEEDMGMLRTTAVVVEATHSVQNDVRSPKTLIRTTTEGGMEGSTAITAPAACKVGPSIINTSTSTSTGNRTPKTPKTTMTSAYKPSSTSSTIPCDLAEVRRSMTPAPSSASIKLLSSVAEKAFGGSRSPMNPNSGGLETGRRESTRAAHEDASSVGKTVEKVIVEDDAKGISAASASCTSAATADRRGGGADKESVGYTVTESMGRTEMGASDVEARSETGAGERVPGITRMSGMGGKSWSSMSTLVGRNGDVTASSTMRGVSTKSTVAKATAATTSLAGMVEDGRRGNSTTATAGGGRTHGEHEGDGDDKLEGVKGVAQGNSTLTVMVGDQTLAQSNATIAAEKEPQVGNDQDIEQEGGDLPKAENMNATSAIRSSSNSSTGQEAVSEVMSVQPVKALPNATVVEVNSSIDGGSNGTTISVAGAEDVASSTRNYTLFGSALISSANTTDVVANTEAGRVNRTQVGQLNLLESYAPLDDSEAATIPASSNFTVVLVDAQDRSANFSEETIVTMAGNETFKDILERPVGPNGTASMQALLLNSTISHIPLPTSQNTTDITTKAMALVENTASPAILIPKNSTAFTQTQFLNSSLSSTQSGDLNGNESFAMNEDNGTASFNGSANSSAFASEKHDVHVLGILAGNLTMLPMNNTISASQVCANGSVTAIWVTGKVSAEWQSLSNSTASVVNSSITLQRNGTDRSRANSTALNRTGIANVGDLSVPFNSNKLSHCDKLHCLNESAMLNSAHSPNETGDIVVGNTSIPFFDTKLIHSNTSCGLNESAMEGHEDKNGTSVMLLGKTLSMFDTKLNQSGTLNALNETALPQYLSQNMTLVDVHVPDTVVRNISSKDTAIQSMALNSTLGTSHAILPEHRASNETAAGSNITLGSSQINNTVFLPNVAESLGYINTTVLRLEASSNMTLWKPDEPALALNLTFSADIIPNGTGSLPAFGGDVTGAGNGAELNLTSAQSGAPGNATVPMANVTEVLTLLTITVSAARGYSSTDMMLPMMNGTSKAEGFNAAPIGNLTQHDGNAKEYDGLPRTSRSLLPTGSIRLTPTSKIAMTTATYSTQSTGPPRTTSFVSTSPSFVSSTSVSSSMRPKITDCADDFDFFEMTDANLAESNALVWYAHWTLTASTGSSAATFHSLGEVPYFGRTWLRSPDYNCGLELGGCTARLSCNEILHLYPNDVETARRVYFVMRMHATVNQVLKSYYDAIQLTQINVAAVIAKIVDTAFQRPQAEDAQACAFLKTSYNNIMSMIQELTAPIFNGKKGFGSDYFKGPLKGTNPSAVGIWWLQFPDPYGNQKQGITFLKGKYETAYKWWFAASIGEMQSSMRFCEGLGMVSVDKRGAEATLGHALMKISMFQRKELSKHVRELNRGAFRREGEMSALAGILGMGIWNNETSSAVEILTDPYQLEEMMTEQSKENLLSRAYLMNKCYLKCTTHPHALSLCAGYNDWEFAPKHAASHGYPSDAFSTPPGSKLAEAEKLMRICPRPDKVCQLECWSQEKSGFTMPLHNIGTLSSEPLNIDIQKKMHEMYEYYKVHGNADPSPPESAQEVNADPLADLTQPRTPRFWLPVCDSDQGYTHIVDFGAQVHGKYKMDQFSRSQDRRSFPISCGDYRSNETIEFMEAMGLTNWHAKGVDWTMNPFFKNYAPLNAAVLIEAPLDNFLALCRLGLAYPQEDWAHVHFGQMDIRREPSQFCGPVDEETRGMNWWVANVWFCRRSEAARALFRKQGMSGAIMGLHKVKNHRALCERWLKTWEGEQVQGLEEVDGSQGKERWTGSKAKGGERVGEVRKFAYDWRGKAYHPKWRSKYALFGKRGALTPSPPTPNFESEEQLKRKGEPDGVQNALSQCEGREGIGLGWRFLRLLCGREGFKAMGGAWKFLLMRHKGLRKYTCQVPFEGMECTCENEGVHAMGRRDAFENSGEEVDAEKKAHSDAESAQRARSGGELDMEEVRWGEERYWAKVGEVVEEEEEAN